MDNTNIDNAPQPRKRKLTKKDEEALYVKTCKYWQNGHPALAIALQHNIPLALVNKFIVRMVSEGKIDTTAIPKYQVMPSGKFLKDLPFDTEAEKYLRIEKQSDNSFLVSTFNISSTGE